MKIKYLIFIALLNNLDYACANAEKATADDYIHAPQSDDQSISHTIIHPQLQHLEHKASLKHTLDVNGLHVNELLLTYNYNNTDVVIDLQLNHDLISDGHFITYEKEDGETIVQNLSKIEINMCHYRGMIRGVPNSRVAVSTCAGINGIIFNEHNVYHIKSGPDANIHSEHYLYKHTDIMYQSNCEVNTDLHSKKLEITTNNGKLRFKRTTSSDSSVHGPYNSNEDSIYIELLMVVDNELYQESGKSKNKVHAYVMELVNIVNSFYVPLNVFIALKGVVIWTENDKIEFTTNATTTLLNFVNYRKESLLTKFPNDNAHLLTGNIFHKTIGIAYKGLICTERYSGGITRKHSRLVTVVATTMAHEMGHNLGMEHDDYKYCNCIDRDCLMVAKETNFIPTKWSSCSLDFFSSAYKTGHFHCLRNKPNNLFGSKLCGNGFVELGEECDCGMPGKCDTHCCNPDTCMFNTNATCATGKCCDLTTCQLRFTGYKCRASKGECDLPEYCSGKSEYCPNDVFRRDTEPCKNGLAYCYRGLCKTHLDQCQFLWGETERSGDNICFADNVKGNEYGNCGVDKLTMKQIPCEIGDVLCGLLHCHQKSDELQNRVPFMADIRHTRRTFNQTTFYCRTVNMDVGRESRDPGLVPNGAKCGENKMCLNEMCLSIKQLRAQGIGVECPNNCSGNGFCNSNGNCHCHSKFGSPTCSDFGAGSSVDSGPLLEIPENSRLAILLLVLLLLMILTVVFGFLYWRRTPNRTPIRTSTNYTCDEILRRVSLVPREIGRRVSIGHRELAQKVAINMPNLEIIRTRLHRTNSPYLLADTRETSLTPSEIRKTPKNIN